MPLDYNAAVPTELYVVKWLNFNAYVIWMNHSKRISKSLTTIFNYHYKSFNSICLHQGHTFETQFFFHIHSKIS